MARVGPQRHRKKSTAIAKLSFVNNFKIQIKRSKLAFIPSYSLYEATEPKIQINSFF